MNRRKRMIEDLDQEIRDYLERETQDNIERGMPPEEARYAALRKFGNLTRVKEDTWEVWTFGWLEQLWQDIRYGLRMLAKSPGFTVAAILTLALGIGANAAIFQLLDAVRLRSLPVPNPHELAEVRIVGGNHGMGLNPGAYGGLTRPLWQEIREHHEPFSGVFAWSAEDVRVGQGSDLRRANGLYVSGEFFRVLGVQPWRGRLILPEDEGEACPLSKAVVSYSYWQGQMGARDIGTGTALMINGGLKEVVGVTPPEFFGLAVGDSFDVAISFCQPKELRRDVFDVTVMGRLRPGWCSNALLRGWTQSVLASLTQRRSLDTAPT